MATGRRVRVAGGVVTLALLCAGTIWGDDDNFPFGPFRMYSTKQELDGEVWATEVEGLTKAGVWVGVRFDDFGLRRADIEGQLGKLAQPPMDVLAAMSDAYDTFGRGDEDFVALRLRERTYDIEDGLPAGETVVTVATLRRD
ncbi:MAG: hypothetical protein M3323_02320 [Actinomycetota bacterium]|nr:hypothetical protein [Actinomycetota bacterium]